MCLPEEEKKRKKNTDESYEARQTRQFSHL